MRVFRTRTVTRFLKRERISDTRLIEAVADAERGLVDADLGGGVIKQRLARTGQGKRGGYRLLIGFRSRHRAVFLFGFAKNERDNVDADELATLRDIAAIWLAANDAPVARAIADGILTEVDNGASGQGKS